MGSLFGDHDRDAVGVARHQCRPDRVVTDPQSFDVMNFQVWSNYRQIIRTDPACAHGMRHRVILSADVVQNVSPILRLGRRSGAAQVAGQNGLIHDL